MTAPKFTYAPVDKDSPAHFTTSKQPLNIYQSDAEKELYQALQRLKGEQ